MKISVTRALAEIKSLTARIQTKTSESLFVAVSKGTGDQRTVADSTVAPATLENRIRADFQSLSDMLARRDMLKRKVIASNGVVKVTIGGEEFTVAEALERKGSIALTLSILEVVRQQFTVCTTKAMQLNNALNAEIEKAVQMAYGNEKGKVDEQQYKAVAAPRIAKHEAALIDPINIEKWFAETNNTCMEFMTEVDFVLSEANAKTEIEIEGEASK